MSRNERDGDIRTHQFVNLAGSSQMLKPSYRESAWSLRNYCKMLYHLLPFIEFDGHYDILLKSSSNNYSVFQREKR